MAQTPEPPPSTSSVVAPGQQPQQTNGLAIASLVCGLVWFGGLGSLLALIFGYRARGEIKRNPTQTGDGLAIGGIVLGWIGIVGAIVAVLAGVALFGIFSREIGSSLEEGFRFKTQLERQTAILNLESALKQAARAEKRYHEANGTYTTDVEVLTERGNWEGVTLGPVEADDETFCVEGTVGGVPGRWHIEEGKKPRRGSC